MENHKASGDCGCRLSEGFSLPEKTYALASYLGMGITGTVAILQADWRWAVPYIIFYWYGTPGIIMRHLACPRCPHLWVYGDCLQFPARIAKLLVKKRKNTPFSTGEKILFYGLFLLFPTYPLYWLASRPLLLTVFLICVSMWYLGQFLYFCKRCRVKQCPFNKAQLAA